MLDVVKLLYGTENLHFGSFLTEFKLETEVVAFKIRFVFKCYVSHIFNHNNCKTGIQIIEGHATPAVGMQLRAMAEIR